MTGHSGGADTNPTLLVPAGSPYQAGLSDSRSGPAHGPWIWFAAVVTAVIVVAAGAGGVAIFLRSQHRVTAQPEPQPRVSSAIPGGRTTSASPSIISPSAASPAQVASEYVADVNTHAWPSLWQLGGGNVKLTYQPDPGPYSYSQMIANFQHTVSVTITSLTSAGDTASIHISALDSAGVTQYFEIDLVVNGGRIVSGSQYFLGS